MTLDYRLEWAVREWFDREIGWYDIHECLSYKSAVVRLHARYSQDGGDYEIVCRLTTPWGPPADGFAEVNARAQ